MVKNNIEDKAEQESQKKGRKTVYERIAAPIKNLTWQDGAMACALLIVFIFYVLLISQYKHVPSPVFGGDLYRDRGFVKNIVEGNPVWSDGFYVDEIQYYPYLSFALEAFFVRLTGQEVDTVFLFFPLLVIVFSGIVWYLLGTALFKNKTWGLLTGLSYLVLASTIEPKSSAFAASFCVPLFLYLWLRYEQTNALKYSILSGILLGITALTHGSRFISAAAIFGLCILFLFVRDIIKKRRWSVVKEYFIRYYLIVAIGLSIALIFFLPLILKYHLHSVNNVTQWGDIKIELLGIGWLLSILGNMFFNTFKVYYFVISIISLVGLIALIISNKNKEHERILMVFLSSIVITIHHLITKPLFNISFLPEKLTYTGYLWPLFITAGTITIFQLMKKRIDKRIIVFLFVVLLLVPVFSFRLKNLNSNRWISYGMQEDPYLESLYGLSEWITANVAKDEAILSNDESGFMLAVLSGRKVMLTRRTHASYYVDIDRRIAEASAAMYANDSALAKDILKQYNVKYFYIDQNLVQYPMRVRTDLEGYLTEHKVQFQKVHDRYDIAVPIEQANTMDLLIIPPQPLSQAFMELWEPIYDVNVQGQVAGQLLRLKE